MSISEIQHISLAVEATGLSKVYSNNGLRVDVLKDLDCSIRQGEVIGVVGASGVGKTTFLHILGTLEHPTEGDIKHFGKNVFSLKDNELSRFRNAEIGFVFQFHRLLPEFTAIENVMMPCLVAGLIRSLSKEKAFNMLKELGLENRTEHKVGQLSGGEQQRVAIARAMVMGPKLLLADEPTGNLDENTGRMVAGQFLSLNKLYGTTMVVVTHNLSLASRMDRCLGLMEGKAVELMASDLKAFGVGRS